MPKIPTLKELLEAGFALEISRFNDVPLGPQDRLVYMDPKISRVVIARAPLCLPAETGPQCHS